MNIIAHRSSSHYTYHTNLVLYSPRWTMVYMGSLNLINLSILRWQKEIPRMVRMLVLEACYSLPTVVFLSSAFGIHKKSQKHLLLVTVIITNIRVNIMATRNIFSAWFNAIYTMLTSAIHKWINMAYQQRDSDRENRSTLEKNLSKCHSAQQKSYTEWLRIEPGSPHWQPGN
jgi:hypothetical protein